METIKKFYVAARHIAAAIEAGTNATCMRNTESEALEEAIRQVEDNEARAACVVQIKLLVTKAKPPVKITTLD